MFGKKDSNKKTRSPRLQTDDYAFRRSRTLTGSTSAQINPSAEKRSQLKTSRLQEHELRQKHRRILRLLGIVAGCILVLGFLISNLIIDSTFRYPQAGPGQPATTSYQESLQRYFAGRPLERFGFSIQTESLQDFMRQKHAEIKTVTVKKAWYGGAVEFVVTFRAPILVWKSSEQTFFVDEEGVSFTYDHFGAPLVPITDESGVSSEVGESVASTRFITFLGRLVGAVNAGEQGRVIGVVIPPSTRQIDLRLENRDYLIKTHIDRDPLQQAEDLLNALRYLDSRQVVPAYVDVRVAGKAFYK